MGHSGAEGAVLLLHSDEAQCDRIHPPPMPGGVVGHRGAAAGLGQGL